jgi:hypothetical protein
MEPDRLSRFFTGGKMNKARFLFAALLATIFFAAPLAAAAPTTRDKQDIAIFALGYDDRDIPFESLGSIDHEIQQVFIDLGRFDSIGYKERLSSDGLRQFIDTIARGADSEYPEEFQFGETVVSKAEFDGLMNAFIIAVPIVTEFNSYFDSGELEWETDMATTVSFITTSDGGKILGVADIRTSGSDTDDQCRSIANAIDDIPIQLQQEARKIPAFQVRARVLAVSGSEIKLLPGRDSGVEKGDEYSIVLDGTDAGLEDDFEQGLVQIEDVGPEASTGRIVYGPIDFAKNVLLRDIPRLGIDVEGYFHEAGATAFPGFRLIISRGYYDFKPYAAVQMPLGDISSYFDLRSVIPVDVVVGCEYNHYIGRFAITPYGGVGTSYVHVIAPVNSDDRTDWLSHIGGQAGLRASFLFTRELKAFAETGYEYWLSTVPDFFDTYGGLSFGAGFSKKL